MADKSGFPLDHPVTYTILSIVVHKDIIRSDVDATHCRDGIT